jgi:hypothetical protein
MEDANEKAFGWQSVEDRELKSRRVRALLGTLDPSASAFSNSN